MKHTAQISYNRATCTCGQMQGVWRGDTEAIGVFTLRAHAIFETHRDNAAPPADLFDYRIGREPVRESQRDLFS